MGIGARLGISVDVDVRAVNLHLKLEGSGTFSVGSLEFLSSSRICDV